MSAVERVGERPGYCQDVLGSERPVACEDRAQILALHVPRGQVEHTLGLSRRVDRQHMRVLDRRGELRLAQEPLPEALVSGQLGREQLQRHPAAEGRVARAVDDAHAATAHEALDGYPANASPG